jgi:hypothetical protein
MDDDLTVAVRDESAVLNDADLHSTHAVRTAHGWTVCQRLDANSEGCGFAEPLCFTDIDDAIGAIEDSVEIGRGRLGSQVPQATLIGWQSSRDGVQHDVYKMPVSTVEDQTRYRD